MRIRLSILSLIALVAIPFVASAAYAPDYNVDVVYLGEGGGGGGGGPTYDPLSGTCSGARVTGNPTVPDHGLAIKIVLTIQSSCYLDIQAEVIPASAVPDAPVGYTGEDGHIVTATVQLGATVTATEEKSCPSTEACRTIVVQQLKDQIGTTLNYFRTRYNYKKRVSETVWDFTNEPSTVRQANDWSHVKQSPVTEPCGSESDPCSHLTDGATFTHSVAPDLFVNYDVNDHWLYPNRSRWTCRWKIEYHTAFPLWRHETYCGEETP